MASKLSKATHSAVVSFVAALAAGVGMIWPPSAQAAGNVTVTGGRDLTVIGDGAGNCLEVNQDDRDIRIFPCRNTTVNGAAGRFLVRPTPFDGDFTIDLRGGNDRLILDASDPRIRGDLEIETDAGRDRVIIEELEVVGDTDIDTGKGRDRVLIAKDRPASATAFAAEFHDDVAIDTNGGNDLVDIGLTSFKDEFRANLGAGDDGVCICATNFEDPAIRFNGAGQIIQDGFVAESSLVGGAATVDDKAVNFEFFPDDCSFLGGQICNVIPPFPF